MFEAMASHRIFIDLSRALLLNWVHSSVVRVLTADQQVPSSKIRVCPFEPSLHILTTQQTIQPNKQLLPFWSRTLQLSLKQINISIPAYQRLARKLIKTSTLISNNMGLIAQLVRAYG